MNTIRDFLYDLRRTITGKFTLIMIALIILSTVGLTYVAASSSSVSSAAPQTSYQILPEIYPVSGGYNISDFAINGYGDPVPQLSIVTNVYMPVVYSNSTGKPSPGTTIAYFNGTTDSNGYANFTFQTPAQIFQYNYSRGYIGPVSIGTTFGLMENGTLGPVFNNFQNGYANSGFQNNTLLYTLLVSNPKSQSLKNLFIYYAAPTGITLPSISLYYQVQNSSGTISPPTSTNGMTFLQDLGGQNRYIIEMPLNKTADKHPVTVAVFNGSSYPSFSFSEIFYNSISAGAYLESILNVPFEFLIPIVGIFSAYLYYGKDKASGVLESIITRPVTKGRILISRFVGTSATAFISLSVALSLADLVVYNFTGSFITTGFFFSMLLGWVAEAIAFSGLMYVAAQFIKSQGAQLGLGIALFFLLVFFWGLIISVILLETHVNLATISGYSLEVALNTISPSFYPTMILSYNSGVYPPTTAGFTVGNTVIASTLGITLVSVIAVGLIWVIVPSVISFMLARSRD